MRLVINGGNTLYMAHFHFVPCVLMLDSGPKDGEKTTETLCTVHEGKCAMSKRPCETANSHVGFAVCSPRDQMNKYKGRKIAFTRAIAWLPRETREKLWTEFNKLSPPPPSRMKRFKGGNHVGEVPADKAA